MVICDYCQEESEYTPIILKPRSFIMDNKRFHLTTVTEKDQDNICLKCLNEEMQLVQSCY